MPNTPTGPPTRNELAALIDPAVFTTASSARIPSLADRQQAALEAADRVIAALTPTDLSSMADTEWAVQYMDGEELAIERVGTDAAQAVQQVDELQRGYPYPEEISLMVRKVGPWRPVHPGTDATSSPARTLPGRVVAVAEMTNVPGGLEAQYLHATVEMNLEDRPEHGRVTIRQEPS